MNSSTLLKSLQTRIAFAAGLALLLVGAALISYSGISTRKFAVEQAQARIQTVAGRQATLLEKEFDASLDIARTLAQALTASKGGNESEHLTRAEVNGLVRSLMEANPHLAGIYTVWEPQAFDGQDSAFAGTTGHDESGRFMAYYAPDGNGNVGQDVVYAYDTDSYYLCPRDTGRECISEPTSYVVQGRDVLLTSLTVPILVDGKFLGIAGVDISLDFLQEMADGLDEFEGSGRMRIFSPKGMLSAASGEKEILAQPLDRVYTPDDPATAILREAITNASTTITTQHGDYHAVVPASAGDTGTPWSVEMIVPEKTVLAKTDADTTLMIALASALVLVGLLFIWLLVNRTMTRPIGALVRQAECLAAGKALIAGEDFGALGNTLDRQDEIGAISRAFHALADYQIQIERAAAAVAEGKLRIELSARSEDDRLGKAVLEMIARLRTILLEVQENATRLNAASRRLDEDSTQTGHVTGQIAATIQHIAESAASQTAEIARAVASLDVIARESAEIETRSGNQMEAITGATQAMQTLSDAFEKIRQNAGVQTEYIDRNRQALENLNATANRIMDGARTQNLGMQRAETSVNSLMDIVKTLTVYVRDSSDATEQTAGQASDGMDLMEMTAHSMDQVHQDTTSLSESIRDLSQRTEQISEITATIKDIAGQTNMIALNAAIEAARSGTQSKAIAEDLLGWQILIQCHLMADLLERPDTASWSAARWETICKRAGLDTFLATDEDGVVTITNAPELTGWRFPEDPKEQASVFRQLMSKNDGVIVQKFQKRSFDNKMYKWVGISRRDKPGIIQVGMNYEISRLAEHSGGFSVLAQEVRKLAEKAASASAEISRIIQTVQMGARDTAEAMQKAGEDIIAAEDLSQRARDAFRKIVDGTVASAERARSVQGTIDEMESASGNVNEAVASAIAIALENEGSASEMSDMSLTSLKLVEQIFQIAGDHASTVAGLMDLNLRLARLLNEDLQTSQENKHALDAMAHGIVAIRENMDMVARLSEENSAAAEEVSASTEEMSAQADEIVSASHELSEMSRGLHNSLEGFEV